MTQQSVRFCAGCGAKQPTGARFCYACGATSDNMTAQAIPAVAVPSLNATTKIVGRVLIACILLIVTAILVCVALNMLFGTLTGHF